MSKALLILYYKFVVYVFGRKKAPDSYRDRKDSETNYLEKSNALTAKKTVRPGDPDSYREKAYLIENKEINFKLPFKIKKIIVCYTNYKLLLNPVN